MSKDSNDINLEFWNLVPILHFIHPILLGFLKTSADISIGIGNGILKQRKRYK